MIVDSDMTDKGVTDYIALLCGHSARIHCPWITSMLTGLQVPSRQTGPLLCSLQRLTGRYMLTSLLSL